jgi:hypothetical protein
MNSCFYILLWHNLLSHEVMVGWLIPWFVSMKAKCLIPSRGTYNLRPTSGLHMPSGGLQLGHMPRSALNA